MFRSWFKNFLPSKSTDSSSEVVSELVNNIIKSKEVVIFSKTYCPYCVKAKDVINSYNLDPKIVSFIELDQRQDCDQIQDYLQKLTGARSVPRVFIGGKFLGGGDDTVKAKENGLLTEKLKTIGAIV